MSTTPLTRQEMQCYEIQLCFCGASNSKASKYQNAPPDDATVTAATRTTKRGSTADDDDTLDFVLQNFLELPRVTKRIDEKVENVKCPHHHSGW